MTLPRTIHTDVNPDNPTFKVKVNGQDIDPTFQVMSLVVTRQVNRIATAEVTLHDGDPAAEDFPISSQEVFLPNASIEIEMGYSAQDKTVFKGMIVSHSIKVYKNRPPILHLTCKHEAFKLTVGRKNAYFYNQKDKDILRKIISAYPGIKGEVGDTTLKHPEMVQHYVSDWDFVVSRAEANGMLVYNEDGKINVKQPDFNAAPSVQLLYGATILNFEAEMDARYQYKSVQASAWDAAAQKMKDVKARDPKVVSPGNVTTKKLSETAGLEQFEIRHSGQIKDVELQEWANAQWLKSQLAKIRGRVKFQGFDKVMPGDMIELGGLGKRFNGKAFVTGVRHELNVNNWETDVSFGLDPKWFHEQYDDIQASPAGGLLPGMTGLHIGVVTKLEKDPEGEDRVRVRIPMIDPKGGDGVWARVACLDAGKNRGSFFRPEINDEVVLGFLNDDPRNPVILGQLNSSKNPAPVRVKDSNHEKGFYTRDKLKLVFHDDDKSITLETPANQSLVIDDKKGSIVIKDKNGNSITLDSKGITLKSSKDITIKGNANVKVDSGINTQIKANAQLKAQGSALAELSSTGVTAIKGSMVKLN